MASQQMKRGRSATGDESSTSGVPGGSQQFWEDFYRERDGAVSERRPPNGLLVREASKLSPGTALDLGCAEGSDALWLAEQGWRVTAVDVSATALERAANRASSRPLAERITWEQHDLSESFPAGQFDLVSSQFLHSPVEAEGERLGVLAKAAAAVAPGGVLLIVGHAGWPSWQHDPPHDYHFHTTSEVLDFLQLSPRQWQVEVEELLTRDLTGPDGQPGTREDNVLRIRRAS